MTNGWIKVSDRKTEMPCVCMDDCGNVFCLNGCITFDDSNGVRHEYVATSTDMMKPLSDFLKGVEQRLYDGTKVRILPNEIIYWYPLPELPERPKKGKR